jgi:hypothetical protein
MHRPPRLIVVRRDQIETFKVILDSADRWPAGTALMLDRRERERRVLRQRATIERRQRQRRAEPNAMWHLRGFVVVEAAQLPIQAIHLNATTSWNSNRDE